MLAYLCLRKRARWSKVYCSAGLGMLMLLGLFCHMNRPLFYLRKPVPRKEGMLVKSLLLVLLVRESWYGPVMIG